MTLQDAPITSLGALLTVLLPIITGYLSTLVYSGIKQLSEKLLKAGSTAHLIGSTLLSFAIGYIGAKLAVPSDAIVLGPLNVATVNAVLTVLLSAGIYKVQKAAPVVV